MSQPRQHRVQELAELIRNQEYRVEPAAVADALVRRVLWEDVPDLSQLIAAEHPHSRILALRSLLPVRHRRCVSVRTRPQLSA